MEDFQRVHLAQLQSIGFPPALLPRLFSKLTSKRTQDLAEVFQLTPSEKSACGTAVICRRKLGAESDVFVLDHVWSCDGGEGGRGALLADQILLEQVAGWLGVAMPWEKRKSAMEKMMKIVCQQTKKSKIVAGKALTDSGYDLVEAILQASDLSEEVVLSQQRQAPPYLSLAEVKKGLNDLGEREVPNGEVQEVYDDWKDRKLRERDSEDWVQCGRYKWREEEEGIVSVSIAVPSGTRKEDIESVMTSQRWKFSVRGRVLVEGEFSGRVVSGESFWTLERGWVSVSVQRVEGGEWGELIVGEVQGEGERREEMEGCVDEVMSRMRQLNLNYSAVTQDGIN